MRSAKAMFRAHVQKSIQNQKKEVAVSQAHAEHLYHLILQI